MLLFLFFLFPVSLTAYCIYKKQAELFITILIGFLAATLVCAINFFFNFTHRVVPYSFGLNFLYYMEKVGLIPVLVMYGIFFLVTKDDVERKVDYFIPLMLAYYSVLLPYNVVTLCESTHYSGFLIFIKPLIYLSMLYSAGLLLRHLYAFAKEKKVSFVTVIICLLLLLLLFPSVLETMYVMNYSSLLLYFLSFLYCLLPGLILFVFKQ
jgi:hypothetical protein